MRKCVTVRISVRRLLLKPPSILDACRKPYISCDVSVFALVFADVKIEPSFHVFFKAQGCSHARRRRLHRPHGLLICSGQFKLNVLGCDLCQSVSGCLQSVQSGCYLLLCFPVGLIASGGR